MPAKSSMPESFQTYKPRSFKVVGTICMNKEGEVLLVRGRTTQKWSFPKGHMKKQETELECARRELFEETGIMAPDNYIGYHKLRAASYYTFYIDKMPELEIHDQSEIDAVTWWPMKQLPGVDANVDVSIVRSLMKNIRSNQNVIDYIHSLYAYTKIARIKKSIDEHSSPRNVPKSSSIVCDNIGILNV